MESLKIWAIYETELFVSHDKILPVRFLIDRDVIIGVFRRRKYYGTLG